MPGTTITDVITPSCAPVHDDISFEYLLDCGEGSLWGSPLIAEDMRMKETVESNSVTMQFPFWERKGARVTEMNLLDTAQDACPDCNGVSQNAMMMRRDGGSLCYGNEHATQFNMACSQDDPLQVIMDELIMPDWRTIYEARTLAKLVGVEASLVANYGSEQVYDATTADAIALGGTSSLNQIHINFAKNLLSCDNLGGVIMHQQQATCMENLGLLTCPCVDDEGSRVYELMDGTHVTVIRDDALKPFLEIDAAQGIYRNILYRKGAILYGEGCHPKPLTADEDECANNGDGATTVYSRRRFGIHPDGWSEMGTNGAGGYAAEGGGTLAELQLAATWQRAVPKNHQPFVFIQTQC